MASDETSPRSLFSSNSFSIVSIVLLVLGSFFLGSLWTKVKVLEKAVAGQPLVAGATTGTPKQVAGNGAQPFPTPDNRPQPTPPPVEPIKQDDRIRGNPKARIFLVEYSDLECPYCKRFHPTAQKIADEYKDQVAWVYRHFPLDQLHSKARKEAEAPECAAELAGNEGFWKMIDKIYEVTPSNNGLNLDDLPNLASQVGLDQGKFKGCLDSGKYSTRVESDYQSGIRSGVQGTPGNFLLDTKTGKSILLGGALPYEQLKPTIDELLKT